MLCSYPYEEGLGLVLLCGLLNWVENGRILIIASVYLGAELRWVHFGVMATILICWAGGILVCYASYWKTEAGYDALFSG
ncbi:hypothetical protein ASPFODRAFT_341138 [Aspergillus luchuensis CBS 106.47]|uniref:Uncharacterized protein n=1 Tax=Aspergillus luchuensis (strain CBS 106.47) TaxID=1137211 RepID=A0A1M3T8A9_ASPLC|nr:hypothetical protein ASPFODRAFT_341138 [Aspergillus luchuensis CBS 106.47]